MHLDAAIASVASLVAQLILILTRCPILVVPGLELPQQGSILNGQMWAEILYPHVPSMCSTEELHTR
jgi:hypothetical protein